MELFRHFPNFRPLPRKKQEFIPLDARSQYSAFQQDFKILEEQLMPTFRALDNKALDSQNNYRWLYIGLILGGAAVSIVSIVQLAFINVSWIGYVEAGTAVLVFLVLTAVLDRSKDHKTYLNARLAAEGLRSEYFKFLARGEDYEDDKNRVRKLVEKVADIRAQGERV